MGGAMSIDQTSAQTIKDSHTQQANNKCAINVIGNQKTDSTMVDTQVAGDVKIQNQIISGFNSCTLRTILDNTNINKLSSQQDATQLDVPGIFSIFNFAGDSINESNSQNIVNQTSQFANSTCQKETDAEQYTHQVVVGSTIGGSLFITNTGKGTKFDCIQDIMAKNFSSNSADNTQKAFQAKISGDVLILIIIVICICVILLVGGKVLAGRKSSGGGIFSSLAKDDGSDEKAQLAEVRALEKDNGSDEAA